MQWYDELSRRHSLLHLFHYTFNTQQASKEDIAKARRHFIGMLFGSTSIEPRIRNTLREVDKNKPPICSLSVLQTLYISAYLTEENDDFKELHESFKQLHDIESNFPSGDTQKAISILTNCLKFRNSTKNKHVEAYKQTSLMRNSFLEQDNFLHMIPISIQLDYDDETLLKEFKSWLKNTRKSNYKKLKRPVNNDDLIYWEKDLKIREIFDIDIWSKASGVKVTDNAIAQHLWPDDIDGNTNFSPIDRLRKTSRKKVKELVNDQFIRNLETQVNYEANIP